MGTLIGFPLPIVKPRVPSGILGPFGVCLEDTSPMKELPNWEDGTERLRLLWSWVRCLDFPRPLAQVCLDPTEFSSIYKKEKTLKSNFLFPDIFICYCFCLHSSKNGYLKLLNKCSFKLSQTCYYIYLQVNLVKNLVKIRPLKHSNRCSKITFSFRLHIKKTVSSYKETHTSASL